MSSKKDKKRLRAGLDLVLIVEDFRDVPSEQKAVGKFATYLGRFFLNGRRYRGPHQLVTTVHLRLADGTVIHGYDCSWAAAHPRGPRCSERHSQPCVLSHGHEGEHATMRAL